VVVAESCRLGLSVHRCELDLNIVSTVRGTSWLDDVRQSARDEEDNEMADRGMATIRQQRTLESMPRSREAGGVRMIDAMDEREDDIESRDPTTGRPFKPRRLQLDRPVEETGGLRGDSTISWVLSPGEAMEQAQRRRIARRPCKAGQA
jgi:hypothetical protein